MAGLSEFGGCHCGGGLRCGQCGIGVAAGGIGAFSGRAQADAGGLLLLGQGLRGSGHRRAMLRIGGFALRRDAGVARGVVGSIACLRCRGGPFTRCDGDGLGAKQFCLCKLLLFACTQQGGFGDLRCKSGAACPFAQRGQDIAVGRCGHCGQVGRQVRGGIDVGVRAGIAGTC